MKELVNFEHFRIIKEAEVRLEAHLDSIVEQAINEAQPAQTRAGALFQNPVKFMKIKNNAKKYQQALVQKALNNVDYEKKKQAAGGEVDKDKLEVLKQANAAKNQALSDKASAISDRMNTLATSPGLQAVKSLAISKAKVAAAETSLKAADAEESKQLKIQIKKLNAQAAKAEADIKDYEKQAEPKAEAPAEAPQQQTEPKVKAEPATEPATEPKTKAEPATEPKADDPRAGIESDIAAYDKNIGDEMQRVATLKKDLEQAKLDAKTGRGSEEEIVKIQKSIDDSNQDIAEMKNKKASLRKQLDSMKDESAGYIGESFTDKFRRLMKDVNV